MVMESVITLATDFLGGLIAAGGHVACTKMVHWRGNCRY